MTKAGHKQDEAVLKQAVLMAALEDAPFDGFTPALVDAAGKRCGAGTIQMTRLFPDGVGSLVEAFSAWADGQMLARLEDSDLKSRKIRERIREAVWTRIEVLTPHKEAARRAAAFLSLPHNVPCATRFGWRTADAIWRAAGDTSSDFNFYSKRAILAGVQMATMVRWFNDDSDGATATSAFLDRRIEEVIRFEKFKSELKTRMKDFSAMADIAPSSAGGRRR